MAISVVQYEAVKTNGAATSTMSWDGNQVDGRLVAVIAGHYWWNTGETYSITTPASSYTQRVTATESNFVIHAAGYTDTFTTGDGDDVTVTYTGSADRGSAICGVELSGADAFDVGSQAVTSGATSLTIPATSAVAVDGSIAILGVVRESSAIVPNAPSYTKTGTAASATWSELKKVQVNGVNMEIYLAVAEGVNSGETIGCTFGNMPASDEMAGIIMVISPVVNSAPTVSDPGTLRAGIGFSKPIGTLVTVADTDSNLSTIRYQCTEANGDITVTLSGSATISSGTNSTHDLTVSGTNAELLTIHATAVYVPTATGDSTVTITATDDEAASDSQAFTVQGKELYVYADNQTDLNSTLATMTFQNAVAESSTISFGAEADDTLENTAQTVLTTSVAQGALVGTLTTNMRRRRRSNGAS